MRERGTGFGGSLIRIGRLRGRGSVLGDWVGESLALMGLVGKAAGRTEAEDCAKNLSNFLRSNRAVVSDTSSFRAIARVDGFGLTSADGVLADKGRRDRGKQAGAWGATGSTDAGDCGEAPSSFFF